MQYLQDLQAAGQNIKALDERIALPPDLAEIMRLFQIISHGRPPAFAGIAGIRITDIEAVYRMLGIVIMPPDEFVDWMLWLDGVFVNWHAERDRAKEKHG